MSHAQDGPETRNLWVPVSRRQLEVLRPARGVARDGTVLTNEEWRFLVGLRLLCFEAGGPVRLNARASARLLGIHPGGKPDAERKRIQRLLMGYYKPTFATVRKEFLDRETREPIIVPIREPVLEPATGRPLLERVVGLIEREWVVVSGDDRTQYRRLQPGRTWWQLESLLAPTPTTNVGRSDKIVPPPDNCEGVGQVQTDPEHAYTNGPPPRNCQGAGYFRSELEQLVPVPGHVSTVSGTSLPPPSYIENLDLDDRSIDRSSKDVPEEEEEIARQIQRGLYSGLAPSVAARDWDGWQDRYRIDARHVLAGRLTWPAIHYAIAKARSAASKVRGKVYFAETAAAVKRGGGPPTEGATRPVTVPVCAAPAGPTTPPDPAETPMTLAEERAEMTAFAALPPRDPRHRIGRKWLDDHPHSEESRPPA